MRRDFPHTAAPVRKREYFHSGLFRKCSFAVKYLRRLNILSFLLFFRSFVLAQDFITLRGIVLSQEDRQPVVGASVIVSNTTIGTATNVDGKFVLKNIPARKMSIAVSAVGYTTAVTERPGDPELELTVLLETAPVQSQTVVVTANKREQSLNEVPVSMSIVEAKMFEMRNTVSLDDALRYVPGVNFQQSQINIRASSGYSRGVGTRVMLLLDGVPLLSGDTGEITFEAIPVFHIDRVEVVKGAGSALYGSGALGGVVNVLTKPIGETTTLWWRLYGGFYEDPSYDQWNWSDAKRLLDGQSVGITSLHEDIGIAASLQRLSDDGYREQDWLRRYNAYVKVTYDLSPYQSLAVSSNLFSQHRGDFLWWKDLKNALRPADAQRNISVTSLRLHSSAHFKHFVTDQFYYEVKGTHFRGDWKRDSLDQRRLDESVSDAIVVDLQGNLSFDGNHFVTMGIVGNKEQVEANIFGTHDGGGFAVYLQDEYTVAEGLSATIGVRHDIQQVTGLPAHQQTNPKIGIRYSPDDLNTIRASAGRGFRAPSIGERYTSTRNTGSAAIVIPSPNLRPEQSATYEVSSTHHLRSTLRVEAALFHSDFTDLIEPNVQSDTVLKAVTVNFKNITQATIQGFETGIFFQTVDRSAALDLHYNYNWAYDAQTKAFLRFRPRHIAGIAGEYRVLPWSFGADYRFVSRIEAIDDKLVELAPIKNGSQRVAIYLLDVRASADLLSIGVPMRVTVNVKNALGYHYNELIGNVSPPRHFVLSLEGMLQ